MDTDFRGTGRTTQQMEDAPQGSVFVWCNGTVFYPLALAHKIGSTDLEIVSPNWLTSEAWRGRTMLGIVIDHAANLTPEQGERLACALTRIR